MGEGLSTRNGDKNEKLEFFIQQKSSIFLILESPPPSKCNIMDELQVCDEEKAHQF